MISRNSFAHPTMADDSTDLFSSFDFASSFNAIFVCSFLFSNWLFCSFTLQLASYLSSLGFYFYFTLPVIQQLRKNVCNMKSIRAIDWTPKTESLKVEKPLKFGRRKKDLIFFFLVFGFRILESSVFTINNKFHDHS